MAFIALPTAMQANIDPKVAEICMKATDFQGCVESMSGQKNNNLSIKSGYDEALIAFEKGDSLKAMKSINSYIKNMRSSSNPYIFFDNDDPSDFEFTYISFSKWLIKKIFRRNNNLISNIMDRKKIYNKDF